MSDIKNIEQSKLNNIADKTDEFINEINQGVKWSDDFLKAENSVDTSYALKKYRRKLKKVKKAITQKPVIALFGASQVGKSYLVKNIFNDDSNNFIIPDFKNGNDYDFIADIDPAGQGSEATSVVTRFTYDKDRENYPLSVKIRILSAKSVVTILLDSYLTDIKKRKAELTEGEIIQHIEYFENLSSTETQYNLDEDDIYDIDDYITELFYETGLRSIIQPFKDSRFWHRLAAVIHRIPHTAWGSVFEILWGKQPKLTKLFNILINELSRIKFSKVIYAGIESVLRKEGTILDVQRLKNILTDQGNDLTVKKNENESYEIKRNTLCALAHEVILNISKSSVDKHKFVDNIDMLDFPGARSRMRLDETDEFSDGEISDMLLRGKVAYLFNSYSMDYEINNLFVCTPDSKTEVREIPELVDKWINYNIGKNKEERTKALKDTLKPPLFVIYTKWNFQLDFDADADTENGKITTKVLDEKKWKKRFDTRIKEDLYDPFKWHEEWTVSDPVFQNNYLLRDYKYSSKIFQGWKKGTEDELATSESSIKKEHEDYYQILEESFKSSKYVGKLFANPEKTWQETSSIGNDGSQYIIDNMQSVANNVAKTTRFLKIINDEKEKTETILKKHHKSEEADKQIREAAKNGIKLQSYMNDIFGANVYNFGYFIEQLTISEYEILHFYSKMLKDKKVVVNQDISKFVLWLKKHPRLTPPKDNTLEEISHNYDANLEILREELLCSSIEEVKKELYGEYGFKEVNANGEDDLNLLFNPSKLFKNTSFTLAEEAEKYLFETKLNAENAEKLKELGFKEADLTNLFENLKANYKKLQLTELIAGKIRKYVDGFKKVSDAEDMIAHITAGVINEFVNNVGWTFYSDSEKDKIRDTNESNNLRLSIPENEKNFDALDEEHIINLFDFMDNLNENQNSLHQREWTYGENKGNKLSDDEIIQMRKTNDLVPMINNYGKWSELMKISFIANCDIPTYNVEANRKLGEIIEKLNIYNFSI